MTAGYTSKLSNKLTGDVPCPDSSMMKHEPHLPVDPGLILGWGVGNDPRTFVDVIDSGLQHRDLYNCRLQFVYHGKTCDLANSDSLSLCMCVKLIHSQARSL